MIVARSWLLLGTSGLAVVGAGAGVAAILRAHHAAPAEARALAVDDVRAVGSGRPGEGAPPIPRAAQRHVYDERIRLPGELTRGDIVNAMSRIKPRAEQCFAETKTPSLINVKLTVASSGRVTAAKVQGDVAGTPAGDCLEAAARAATFRSFNRPSLTLTWPFAHTVE